MREAPLLLGLVMVMILGCWVVALRGRLQEKALRLAALEETRRELEELGRLYLEEGARGRSPQALLERARELGLDLEPPRIEAKEVAVGASQ